MKIKITREIVESLRTARNAFTVAGAYIIATAEDAKHLDAGHWPPTGWTKRAIGKVVEVTEEEFENAKYTLKQHRKFVREGLFG